VGRTFTYYKLSPRSKKRARTLCMAATDAWRRDTLPPEFLDFTYSGSRPHFIPLRDSGPYFRASREVAPRSYCSASTDNAGKLAAKLKFAAKSRPENWHVFGIFPKMGVSIAVPGQPKPETLGTL
jgi:hypothetical protein